MQNMNNSGDLISRFFTVIENEVLPKTRLNMAKGNCIFGAAIFRKSDLSLVIADVNNEVENPMWHGEVHTIKKFWEIQDRSNVPNTKDCIFLSTHEPCSLCLSALTWSGFDNFYYLFNYEHTRDQFKIAYDILILKEVFGTGENDRALYNRKNNFWSSYNIPEMISNLDESDPNKQPLTERMNNIMSLYVELADAYKANSIKPLLDNI